jgi:predicted ester cyclase
MMQEEHKQIAKDIVEAFNQRQLDDLVGRLIDPKATVHLEGRDTGPAGWVREAKACLVSFPDARNDITGQTMEGDKLVTMYEFTGTHLGPFAGHSATGKSFRVEGKLISRLKDGRLVEMEDTVDGAALMQQLGIGG